MTSPRFLVPPRLVAQFSALAEAPCECSSSISDSLLNPTAEEDRTATLALLASLEAGESEVVPWRSTIALEGTLTGDGRLIEEGALRWDDLPLPFRYSPSDEGGHDGAVSIGLINSIERSGGLIEAAGVIVLSSDLAHEARQKIVDKVMRGVSVDLDEMSYEVRISEEVIEAAEAEWEELMGDIDSEADSEDGEAEEEPERETDEEGRVTVYEFDAGSEIMVVTDARIRAATLVGIPAFIEATIEMVDSAEGESPSLEVVAASAAPSGPPAAWFRDPQLPGPSPLSVSPEGRIMGHLATWGVCHVGISDSCVEAPRSSSGYAYFRLGTTRAVEADGRTVEIPTGKISMGGGHAGARASASETVAHYESTSLAAADVVVGEDQFGIWVAGAARGKLSDAQLAELAAAPLSGDWRLINGKLELVAALSVNVPGFPIPHTAGLVAGGRVESLVAAGVAQPNEVPAPSKGLGLTAAEVELLAGALSREKDMRKNMAETLAMRVHTTLTRAKVRAFAQSRRK